MNCLVTKINASSSNPNLELYNKLGITFKNEGNGAWITEYDTVIDGFVIKASSNAYFNVTANKVTAEFTNEYIVPQGNNTMVYIWPAEANTDVTVYLPKRSLIKSLDRAINTITASNFNSLKGMVSLVNFIPAGANVDYDVISSDVLKNIVLMGSGSKISLEYLPAALENIVCNYDIVTGNLSYMQDKTSLKAFNIKKTSSSTKVSGSIANLPLDNLEHVIIANNNNITGSIEHFNNSTKIVQLQLNNTHVSGSINNLPITLTVIEVYSTDAEGDIKTLADNQVAAGRTSGTLSVQSSGNIKNNGTAYTGTKTITFSGGSYTIS